MKLRAALLSSLALLAGCSTTPEPNQTLVALADKAAAPQASELAAEAERLCGTRDGEPLCTVAPAAAGTLTSTDILSEFDNVPTSSLPVLATAYVQLAMHEAPRPVESSSAFNEMKQFERAAVFGLDHYLAFAGADTVAITASQEAHENVLYSLGAEQTAAPVAYDLGQYPTSPMEFTLALEADATLKWLNSACKEGLPAPDREFALIQAGNAAARYIELGGNPAELGL